MKAMRISSRCRGVRAAHLSSFFWRSGSCVSLPLWILSLPRHVESASEEREGDPGQPDGSHAGLLQEELCQPVGRQSGQSRTTPASKHVEFLRPFLKQTNCVIMSSTPSADPARRHEGVPGLHEQPDENDAPGRQHRALDRWQGPPEVVTHGHGCGGHAAAPLPTAYPAGRAPLICTAERSEHSLNWKKKCTFVFIFSF